MIITIGIEKGGTGKSTTATNLACFLASKGEDVVIIDGDIQKTASDWMSVREDFISENPGTPAVDVFAQNKEIDKLSKRIQQKYKYVIIDVGGQANRALGSSLLVSDVIYMPVRPSQADLWTLDKMEQLIDNAKGINPKLQAYAFLNQAPTHPTIQETNLAKEYLGDFDNIKLSSAVLSERKVFRDAMLKGVSVFELKDGKAQREMKKLCSCIINGE